MGVRSLCSCQVPRREAQDGGRRRKRGRREKEGEGEEEE